MKQETLASYGILITLMNRIVFDFLLHPKTSHTSDYLHATKPVLFVSINKFLYYHMPLFQNGQDLFDATLWTGQMIHIISLPNEYLGGVCARSRKDN